MKKKFIYAVVLCLALLGLARADYGINNMDGISKSSAAATYTYRSGDTMTNNLIVGASIQANVFNFSDGTSMSSNPYQNICGGGGVEASPTVILHYNLGSSQIFTTTNTYTKGGFDAQIASTKTVTLSKLYATIDTPGDYSWGIRLTTGAIVSGAMSWGTFTEQVVPVGVSSYTWTVDKDIPANAPLKMNIISVPDGCTISDVLIWGTNE
jgi:hypothetical protein